MTKAKSFLTLVVILLVGCSTGAQRSLEEILGRDTPIATLHEQLEQAEREEMYLKAPATLQMVQDQYRVALQEAQASKNPNAGIHLAREGVQMFARAMAHAKRSEDVLGEAYELRIRALDADANEIYPERAREIEQDLIEAAELVEEGKDRLAVVKRDEVVQRYAQLELDSLKKGVTLRAILAVQKAEEFGAETYAPKSFKLAKSEIAATKKLLEADRQDLQKARTHAGKALYLADRARQIAALAKDFDRRDFSREDIILWYHENLDIIADSVDAEIAYDQDNQAIIDSLVANISKLKVSIKESVIASKNREARIQKLETRISELLKDEEKEKLLATQDRERLETIRNLFDAGEATIYQEENDVIINVHGFYFPVGKAKIEAQNYPLVKKLVDAIHLFPFAKQIIVTGHTDAIGSDSMNLMLSRERAYNLRQLFETIGQIPGGKIIFYGYGEKKPVASNETEEGRALNRRIEVTIRTN